ncbi:MAG: hypothetical protein WBF07_24955 [Xanthobacteraceae bacterium]
MADAIFCRAIDSRLCAVAGLAPGGMKEIGMTHTATLTDQRRLRGTMI